MEFGETKGDVEVTRRIGHGCVWSCKSGVHASYSTVLGLLDPGDGGTKLFQNVWNYLPVDMV
jgi:uncharacterized protein YuzB (UPF0349 family)